MLVLEILNAVMMSIAFGRQGILGVGVESVWAKTRAALAAIGRE